MTTNGRTPFLERNKDNVTVSKPPKKQIKSLILGKNRRDGRAIHESPTPPQSPTRKRVKPTRDSPMREPASKSAAEPKEVETRPEVRKRVFHHSGQKNYFLQDGPVTLRPFENSYALGGYGVRCTQNGAYVGLIIRGEEILCRKLLVHETTTCYLTARAKDGNLS
jgi:hypothetical protein